jgi:hypothetical protein
MSAARLCLAALVAAGACAAFAGPAAAASGPSVKLYDDCDPATFDASVGPGTCVGDGETRFLDFIATVAAAKSHPDWRISPAARTIGAGRSLDVRNRGGEVHTFTDVTAVGFQATGCVPPLNEVLVGSPALNPLCTRVPDVVGPTAFAPGERRAVGPLSPGTHLFECMIHPWMRTMVHVQDD